MASFRMVNLGDSVPWGQGLLEGQKYDRLVKAALGLAHPEGVTLQSLAHSGAVIGAHPASGGPAPGEVPVSRPTVIEQCDSFSDSPETVDLVLVNGGINDVGVATILNPFALVPSLGARIESACHDRMRVLLQHVSTKFSKQSCKILVTGYYLILSNLSDPVGINMLLGMNGIAAPAFLGEEALLDPVVDRCEQFFEDSTKHLKAAAAQTHDPRIQFVSSGFTPSNAMFVTGTSLLWGLDEQTNPEDPVANQRRAQCDVAFPGPLQVLHREQCHRASAGHPNPAGAVQYKDRILAAVA